MIRTSFNADWSVRPKVSPFAELAGHHPDSVPVTLPHDAMLRTERSPDSPLGSAGAYHPAGHVEYQKVFDVPESHRGKRIIIEFEGVYRDAMVFINDNYAGQRPYGYSNFHVPVDPFLRFGESNTIRVEARASEDSRWYAGLGIYRDTHLLVSDPVHIAPDGVRVTTPDVDDERAVVCVATTVLNEGMSTRTLDVETEIRDANGSRVASDVSVVTLLAGESAIVRHRTYIERPALWDPDAPNLYTVETRLKDGQQPVDQEVTSFGIRTLRLDPEHGLRINDRTVKLRGACIHHDNGILGAATIARAEERRVQVLKEAGFNAIRSAHNPVSKAMLEACDRHGMLVMDEAFDVWAHGKSSHDYSIAFAEWWERDLEAMVAKDFNHPSVIFYSIGNEILDTGTDTGGRWGRKLAEKIRSLDATRYVTNGINPPLAVLSEIGRVAEEEGLGAGTGGVNTMLGQLGDFMNKISTSSTVTERTAESYSVLDAAGMNYSDGRYLPDRELFPHRIIVGTETFPTHIDVNWALVTENSHVIGDFTWTGWDYLGEAGIGRVDYPTAGAEATGFRAPYPWLTAWCGDIDITGHRRPASYYRETVFGLRSTPFIAVQRPEHYGREATSTPWAWSDSVSSWSWDVSSGSPVKVEVYSAADEVELVLNDKSLGRAKTGPAARYYAEFETEYEPGELVAIAYREGREQGRFTLRSAGANVRFQVDLDRDMIRADDTDLAFVSVTLVDGEGNLHNDVERAVTIGVEGSGQLQGFGSAAPATTERFDADTRTTFDGRVLAAIRPTGPGEIVATISAPECDPVTVRITAVASDES